MSGVEIRVISEEEAGIRLDRWMRRHFPGLGQGQIEKLLRTGQIRVDGKRVKAGFSLESGQKIRIPPLSLRGSSVTFSRNCLPISEETSARLCSAVLYRDSEVLVLNKPNGLAVQGGSGLRYHLDGWLEALRFEASERPRLVHRLDKDTSGLLLLARTPFAAQKLGQSFRTGEVRKLYYALTLGVPQPIQGQISTALYKHKQIISVADLPGKYALTLYRVVETIAQRFAFVLLNPVTGRTHQLRVHMAHLGTPVLGDKKYGKIVPNPHQHATPLRATQPLHLHATHLTLPHPRGGYLTISAPLPVHMKETCLWLGVDIPQDLRNENITFSTKNPEVQHFV